MVRASVAAEAGGRTVRAKLALAGKELDDIASLLDVLPFLALVKKATNDEAGAPPCLRSPRVPTTVVVMKREEKGGGVGERWLPRTESVLAMSPRACAHKATRTNLLGPTAVVRVVKVSAKG